MAKIGFIGMGNMGFAILKGLLKIYEPADIVLSSAHREKMERVTGQTGVPHAASNTDCAAQVKYLLLAVKPQYFDAVFADIKEVLRPDQVIISLAPGLTIESYRQRLGSNLRFVRAMPNTPALLGEGMTGVSYDGGLFTEEEKREMEILFTSFGKLQLVEERLMDAVGCVSGSSPAFVYMFIEALADGAVKYGLPRAAACQMAAQAVLGSAKMVLETGKHPEQLKDEVCSPGGTTIQGVSALEEAGFRSAVIRACDACYKKSTEIQ